MEVRNFFQRLASKEYVTGINDLDEVTTRNLNIVQRFLRCMLGCYAETHSRTALKEVGKHITRGNTFLSQKATEKVSNLFNKIDRGSRLSTIYSARIGSALVNCDYNHTKRARFYLQIICNPDEPDMNKRIGGELILSKKDNNTLKVEDTLITMGLCLAEKSQVSDKIKEIFVAAVNNSHNIWEIVNEHEDPTYNIKTWFPVDATNTRADVRFKPSFNPTSDFSLDFIVNLQTPEEMKNNS